MELSDLWLKMAKNENLTPQELDFLRIQGKNTQQNNALTAGWVNADGTMDLQRPRISSPFFATNALSPLKLTRATDTAITTGTDTAVSFETQEGFEGVFIFDTAAPTKVRLAYAGQAFAVMGIVGWEANATGYRNAKLEGFTQADASLGSVVLHSHAGWSGADNVFPFCYLVPQNALPTMAYFTITVGHTRGADLNLLFFDIGIFVV